MDGAYWVCICMGYNGPYDGYLRLKYQQNLHTKGHTNISTGSYYALGFTLQCLISRLAIYYLKATYFGVVYENKLIKNHSIMIPPKYKGKVKFIAPKGKYNIDEKLLELEFQDRTFVLYNVPKMAS
uniref:Putative v-type atpase v1 domain subunit a n=1 Tax=Ixodes ricinus TaxID=34613 RepID=A0A0K8RC24_IXORI